MCSLAAAPNQSVRLLLNLLPCMIDPSSTTCTPNTICVNEGFGMKRLHFTNFCEGFAIIKHWSPIASSLSQW